VRCEAHHIILLLQTGVAAVDTGQASPCYDTICLFAGLNKLAPTLHPVTTDYYGKG